MSAKWAYYMIQLIKEIPPKERKKRDIRGLRKYRRELREIKPYNEQHMNSIYNDDRLVNLFTDGDCDGWRELYIINADSEADVRQFMQDNNLHMEYVAPYNSAYDCTGQVFGGYPSISKMYDGRYTLRYTWCRDV